MSIKENIMLDIMPVETQNPIIDSQEQFITKNAMLIDYYITIIPQFEPKKG